MTAADWAAVHVVGVVRMTHWRSNRRNNMWSNNMRRSPSNINPLFTCCPTEIESDEDDEEEHHGYGEEPREDGDDNKGVVDHHPEGSILVDYEYSDRSSRGKGKKTVKELSSTISRAITIPGREPNVVPYDYKWCEREELGEAIPRSHISINAVTHRSSLSTSSHVSTSSNLPSTSYVLTTSTHVPYSSYVLVSANGLRSSPLSDVPIIATLCSLQVFSAFLPST